MHPGARIAASIELVDRILESFQTPRGQPADNILSHYFKNHRYIGSKDRGAISELVYAIIRHCGEISWWLEQGEMKVSGRSLVIAALLFQQEGRNIDELFSGTNYSPPPLTPIETKLFKLIGSQPINHPGMPAHVRCNIPASAEPLLRERFGDTFEKEMRALNEEAPVDLRVNTLKTTREALLDALKKEGFDASPTPRSQIGVRLKKRNAAFTTQAFKDGWFEMQDEGSQLVASLVRAKPGDKVIDFCAGAGGKSLAIAAATQNKGQVLAWDISERRLEQIRPRIKRAGTDNIRVQVIESESDPFIKRHKQTADWVVVDAPCSGSGTWRRNPDAKWRFNLSSLEELTGTQARILESAARLVKPSGFLLYITCSIFNAENEKQLDAFLIKNPQFNIASPSFLWDKSDPGDAASSALKKNGDYLRLSPHQDGTDGFFAALLQRTSVGQEIV